jgi:hypothetical protein
MCARTAYHRGRGAGSSSRFPRAPKRKERAPRKSGQMTPDKNAQMAIFSPWTRRATCSTRSSERMNEIYLFSSPWPIRRLHSAVGWIPEAIAEHAVPALTPSFMPIDRSGDAFFLDLL